MIAEWAADAAPQLRARLGLPGAVPDLATIWRVLTKVDPAAHGRGLGGLELAGQWRPGARVVVSVNRQDRARPL